MTLDQHFTPIDLARQMVATVRLRKVDLIGDFSVGLGHLLRAALERWPNAEYVGVDKDPEMVRMAKDGIRGFWLVGDFLEEKTQKQLALRSKSQLFDLVLLNPPFSVKGCKLTSCLYNGVSYRCSLALKFVVESLPLLRKGGELVAVVPNGMLCSMRDSALLSAIMLRCELHVLKVDASPRFPKCDIQYSLIRLRVVRPAGLELREIIPPYWDHLIGRGRFDHVRYKNAEAPADDSGIKLKLLHSTNLRGGQIWGAHSTIIGDAKHDKHARSILVFPRVGRVKVDKVVVISEPGGYEFTQCLMIIRCGDAALAHSLRRAILNDWDQFLLCYGGTGAQYTTISKISEFLNGLSEAGKICKPPPLPNLEIHTRAG